MFYSCLLAKTGKFANNMHHNVNIKPQNSNNNLLYATKTKAIFGKRLASDESHKLCSVLLFRGSYPIIDIII